MSNKRRTARPLGQPRYAGATEPHPRRGPKTYWNGQPTRCERGRAIVADSPRTPDYWAREERLVGCTVPVVKVEYAGNVQYLYDRANEAWNKVTVGRGSPQWGHRNLAIEEGSYRAN